MTKIVNRLKQGFSLNELMVAIFVLAVLAAIAIPTYRDYIIRAKMVEVLTVTEHFLDEAKKQYISAGTIPSSVLGIASGTPTAYTGSACIDFINYDDGASWNNIGKAALVQAIISSECGQGIQDFAAGVSGAYNRVSMAFVATGETLTQYCGAWDNSNLGVPLQYLPTGCQNNNFESSVTG